MTSRTDNRTPEIWRRYRIMHDTEYCYAYSVSSARHRAHLLPVSRQDQQVTAAATLQRQHQTDQDTEAHCRRNLVGSIPNQHTHSTPTTTTTTTTMRSLFLIHLLPTPTTTTPPRLPLPMTRSQTETASTRRPTCPSPHLGTSGRHSQWLHLCL